MVPFCVMQIGPLHSAIRVLSFFNVALWRRGMLKSTGELYKSVVPYAVLSETTRPEKPSSPIFWQCGTHDCSELGVSHIV
jgi:hypothetical protein